MRVNPSPLESVHRILHPVPSGSKRQPMAYGYQLSAISQRSATAFDSYAGKNLLLVPRRSPNFGEHNGGSK